MFKALFYFECLKKIKEKKKNYIYYSLMRLGTKNIYKGYFWLNKYPVEVLLKQFYFILYALLIDKNRIFIQGLDW